MGTYSCDLCHKSTKCDVGRWACAPCKFDVCPTCQPPLPPPVPMTAFIQCKSMHPLQWSVDGTGYLMSKFNCDICHKSTECSAGRFSCAACKYDVCRTCRQPDFSKCSKGHVLAWSIDSTGYLMGKFSCDVCHKSSDCINGRWGCAGCKYDVCPHCNPAPVQQAPPVPMMAYIQCGNGHYLAWCADTAGYMAGTYSCDVCKKANKCTIGRWSCKADKYDICLTCRPPVVEKCPKSGHEIKLSFDGAGYLMGKYSCDKCKKSWMCADGRYTCPCKYDICPTCKSS